MTLLAVATVELAVTTVLVVSTVYGIPDRAVRYLYQRLTERDDGLPEARVVIGGRQ